MQVLEFAWQSLPIERLGWCLVHFSWQGLSLAALAALALAVIRNKSANARYCVGLVCLLAMLLSPVITYWCLPGSNGPRTAAASEPISLAAPDPTASTEATFNAGSNARQAIANADLSSKGPSASGNLVPLDDKAPTASQHVAHAAQPWLPWLVGSWLTGVVLLSARSFAGWCLLRAAWQRRLEQTTILVRQETSRLATRLGIRRAVPVYQSALAAVPLTWGAIKPVIVLPAAGLAGFTPAELEALLAHELAHIRRHDYMFNLAQTLVETLLFYHPGVWWLSTRVRQEREHACDDLAASIIGSRVVYAGALARVAELSMGHSRWALAASGGDVAQRIRRLLAPAPAQSSCVPHWILGTMIGSVVLFSGIGALFALDRDPVAGAGPGSTGLPRGNQALSPTEASQQVLTMRENGGIPPQDSQPGQTEETADAPAAGEQDPYAAACWGTRSKLGMRLGLMLDPPRGPYAIGQRVGVSLLLRNETESAVVLTMPSTEFLEKFDFDLSLVDREGNAIPWRWGGLRNSDLPTISGGIVSAIGAQSTQEVAKTEFVMGADADASLAFARLHVAANHMARLGVSISGYGYAQGDQSEPLQSGQISFLVQDAAAPAGQAPADNAEAPTTTSEAALAAEGWGPALNDLRVRLVLLTQPIVGQPLLVRCEIKNFGSQKRSFDPQGHAPFRCLRVLDEGGKSPTYIGGSYQTSGTPQEIAPGETQVLFDDTDVARFFLLNKPGMYTLSAAESKDPFRDSQAGGNPRQTSDIPASAALAIQLKNGELPLDKQLLTKALELAPKGWDVIYREAVIFSYTPTNLKRDATYVQLWHLSEPNEDGGLTLPANTDVVVTYLGQTKLGHAYVSAPAKARSLWPEYLEQVKTLIEAVK